MTGAAAHGLFAASIAATLPAAPSVGRIERTVRVSAYPVSDLAAASVGALAAQVAALVEADSAVVSGALADAWFEQAVLPVDWSLPSPWDAIAGDYRCADGWIRLHTNAPAHRAAAVAVLHAPAERAAVADAVAGWTGVDLETAIVAAGGCAALLRSPEAWAEHPQGVAVAAEPLIGVVSLGSSPSRWRPGRRLPLDGLRVLDLTRVIAGPVATRALASLGASVLRIDPPDWDEPAIVPEMTLGKRAARLDARVHPHALAGLLAEADVLVHGYRPGALDHLGLGADARARIRPGLVEATLSAYGWSGPLAGRRGFDSLVQMSSGIAAAGMAWAGADRPVPLPVQALDHATGWLMAAAVIAGLRERLATGRGSIARLSLARTAALLESGRGAAVPPADSPPPSLPLGSLRRTPWGRARVLPVPFRVPGVRPAFAAGPEPLGASAPVWA